jgi:UDP:flavonoid glycosyltransferase YjiC (YdhE family)
MRFDIVLGGDWRLEGGIAVGVDHELRALAGAGLRIGLLQLDTHLLKAPGAISEPLLKHLKAGRAVLISNGKERINTQLLCLHHPAVLGGNLEKFKRFNPKRVVIVAQRPPLDGAGGLVYEPRQLHRSASELFPDRVFWAPISGVCRGNLVRAAPDLPILDRDWTHFVYAEEWKTNRSRPRGSIPIMGRHSRPAWDKWPDNREQLFTIYPAVSDISVRFLGAGEQLLDLAGKIPRNWTLLNWDAIPVVDFVRSIDFFVYYHHSSWIEGFGRTILEAMASGCVAILPEYLRESFGDAALYALPEQVCARVRQLYADWSKYRAWSRRGRELARKSFGPERFLAMVRYLLKGDGVQIVVSSRSVSRRSNRGKKRTDVAASAVPATLRPGAPAADAKPQSPARHPSFDDYDVVYCGDFLVPGDAVERIAEEITINSSGGYSSALLNIGRREKWQHDLPLVLREHLKHGRAVALTDPGAWVACGLLVLMPVRTGERSELALRLAANRVVVLPDEAYQGELLGDHKRFCEVFGNQVSWAALSAPMLARLETKVPVERRLWTPSVVSVLRRSIVPHRSPIIGRAAPADPALWPDVDTVLKAYPDRPDIGVHVLGWPAGGLEGLPEPPQNWRIFDADKISLQKFIEKLDFFVFYPKGPDGELPLTAIGMAMVRGVPVLLPPSLRTLFQRGPIYVEAEKVAKTVAELFSDPARMQLLRNDTVNTGAMLFGPQHQRRRLAEYVRPAAPTIAASVSPAKSRRMLMLSSNGTGIGHVVRQLAIARRLSQNIDPVFVTMGHAVELIRGLGYAVEYLPSAVYSGAVVEDWEKWFELEIEQLVRYYQPEIVVFDGNIPPDGLLRAVGASSGVRMAWIRRGMWQQQKSTIVSLQRYFDLVIEPGDIAQEMDRGATSRERSEVVVVPPIRLLDREELLPREGAAKALSIDPKRPSALVQLGSGFNRDLVGLIDLIVQQLKKIPGLQVVLAEWAISSDPLQHWPGTRLARGFPISQYFNAFDFTISATGYNSFNEIISFELPAIFIANTHPEMDDQHARAQFAESHGAAVTLKPSNMAELQQIVPLLLVEKSREFMKANCRRIAMDNGALAAAQALERLIGNDLR